MRDKMVKIIRGTGVALAVVAVLLVVGAVGIEIERALNRLPEWVLIWMPTLSLAFWAAVVAWLR